MTSDMRGPGTTRPANGKRGALSFACIAAIASLASGCVIEWPLDPEPVPPGVPVPPPPPEGDTRVVWELIGDGGQSCFASTDDAAPFAVCAETFNDGDPVYGFLRVDTSYEVRDLDFYDLCGGDMEFFDFGPYGLEFYWYPNASSGERCPLNLSVFSYDDVGRDFLLEVGFGDQPPPQKGAYWELFHSEGSCVGEPDSAELSCNAEVRPGDVVTGLAFFEAGTDIRGLGLRDTCGGELLDVFTDHRGVLEFVWQVPMTRGCELALMVVDEGGQASEHSVRVPMAEFVAPSVGPWVEWDLRGSGVRCSAVAAADGSIACDESFVAGRSTELYVQVHDEDAQVKSLELVNDCDGGWLRGISEVDSGEYEFEWIPPSEARAECALRLRLENHDGTVLELPVGVSVALPGSGEPELDWDIDDAQAGSAIGFSASIDWNGPSGDYIVVSSCGGEMSLTPGARELQGVWATPQTSGTCELSMFLFGADGRTHVRPVEMQLE
ncbi:hypothetical protein [Haliangium ochraceum]|uniref:Uncharacterized protein n=1 Tax=Haliangium ochraceum (strain DSM 14365 / JCM 11303 / SMP-2) TaxID=502025 RepID=D0LGW9_HALO1|nr:hypothetical protein [Haliangium ochraceum]ACY14691.1 hypothetical protein Hoch_2146 [Haliangium ochraceum DSM 14365]